MSVLRAPYVGAKVCTGAPMPGPKALASWYLGAFGDEGGTNLGVYNCRNVRGGSTTSLHGEGRAVDLGTPDSRHQAWSWKLARLLVDNSAELGVQCVIHNRMIWSVSRAEWEPYTGAADHYDHLHVELTWTSGKALTAAQVQHLLGDPSPSAARPTPAVAGLRPQLPPTLRPGAGPSGWGYLVQTCLGAGLGGGMDELTVEAVRLQQRRYGLVVDGVVGPWTWTSFVAAAGDPLRVREAYGHPGVEVLQNMLGLRGPQLDRKYGPASVELVKAVQRYGGITADGVVGAATRAVPARG